MIKTSVHRKATELRDTGRVMELHVSYGRHAHTAPRLPSVLRAACLSFLPLLCALRATILCVCVCVCGGRVAAGSSEACRVEAKEARAGQRTRREPCSSPANLLTCVSKPYPHFPACPTNTTRHAFTQTHAGDKPQLQREKTSEKKTATNGSAGCNWPTGRGSHKHMTLVSCTSSSPPVPFPSSTSGHKTHSTAALHHLSAAAACECTWTNAQK